MSHPGHTYEVHFETTNLAVDVTSPVRSSGVKYYDSGVWIDRETDRIFVPYRRVKLIREIREGTEHEATTEEPERPAEESEEPAESASEPPTDPVE